MGFEPFPFTVVKMSVLRLVSTDNFTLTEINCHKNVGNEFASTRIIILYYLACLPLSQIFDIETSPQN